MTTVSPQPARVRTAALVAWIIGLAIAWWSLRLLGDGPLAAPPVGSWHSVSAWADARDEADIAMGLARLGAMVGVGYLFVLSTIGAALRLACINRTDFVDRLLPQWVVGLLDSSRRIGLTAAVGVAAIALPAPDPTLDAVPELAQSVAAESAILVATPIEAGDDDPGGTLVMTPADATEPAKSRPAESPTTGSPTAGPELRIPAPIPNQPDSLSTWTTEAGDHLWAIAESTVADHGVLVESHTVESYWLELIEHNRSRLLDQHNPDLIVPGQVFHLPPVSDQV